MGTAKAPPPPVLASPPPPLVQEGSREDREQAALAVWHDLVAPRLPSVTGSTLLDLGCGEGHLLRYLAATSEFRQLIGVDDLPLWRDPELDADASTDMQRVRFTADGVKALAEIPTSSVDVITSMGFLERQTPEDVATSASECFRILRPGGALFARIRPATSAVIARGHPRVTSPYARFFAGERDLARLMRARFDEPIPYANWLTATSYILLFHRASFETLSATRTPNEDAAEALAAARRGLPGVGDGELVDRLDLHLVRPVTLDDLPSLGTTVDTRPLSIRQASK